VEQKRFIFPDIEESTAEGIIAVGGDLHPQRLIKAYRSGIFPWFSESEPIIWWSPDPRFVLFPKEIKVSRSMTQVLKKGLFQITYDFDFAGVIKTCRDIRYQANQPNATWITEEMLEAYLELHQLGYAHSVEAWQGDRLVGGLYGVSLGQCFFGESMFAKVSNASKAAFITLVQDLEKFNFALIDCQIYSNHFKSLGARNIPRQKFKMVLDEASERETLMWTRHEKKDN